MKTPEEITRWCDMMLKCHPNIEDTNFFNSIKDYMKEQRPQGDSVSRKALKEDFNVAFFNDEDDYKKALQIIDNAQTVENPEYDEGFNAGYAEAIKNLPEYRKLADKFQRTQDDLISRSWVKHNVLSLVDPETRIYAKHRLDNAPPVKLKRPQGEWGPCYENYKNGMFYRDCSICGKATITGDWKFCPYCGAEMKGGTE